MNFFNTFTRPSEENLWNSENLSPILHPKNPKKTSNMRALIRITLRLLPVAAFVFAANTMFAQATLNIHQLKEYKAKIDANADNPEFNYAEAKAFFEAQLAEYGLTELPDLTVANGAASLVVPQDMEPASAQADADRQHLMRALRAEIELYQDDPAMADYVTRLRAELQALEGSNN